MQDNPVFTPAGLEQVIDLVIKDRQPDTGLPYDEAFRSYALDELCRYVRQVKPSTGALVTSLENIFAIYEAEKEKP